jgi:hypothetical protein
VSLVCFGLDRGEGTGARGEGVLLDGQPVAEIHADLTGRSLHEESGGVDVTQAKALPENAGVSFQGSQKIGAFDIPGELARLWLKMPNPHGKSNRDVLKPSWNGLDLTRRPRDGWIIDFGTDTPESEAALYEIPFQYVLEHVKPERSSNGDKIVRINWWRHGRPRPEMRAAIAGLPRYIVTPHVAKHRLFLWLDARVLPDKMLIVTARSDDATFGILHSRFHEVWSLAQCTWLGKGNDPRYTPTTCFETFPFPVGWVSGPPRNPTNGADVGLRRADGPLGIPANSQARLTQPTGGGATGDEPFPAIAAAARRLNELRDNWLNPPEWVEWVITPEEERVGYPRRPVAKAGFEAELKQRTLTNLYNQRPAWLAAAHRELDSAVAHAYGWEDYTEDWPEAEILRRLLQLNRQRTGEGA